MDKNVYIISINILYLTIYYFGQTFNIISIKSDLKVKNKFTHAKVTDNWFIIYKIRNKDVFFFLEYVHLYRL